MNDNNYNKKIELSDYNLSNAEYSELFPNPEYSLKEISEKLGVTVQNLSYHIRSNNLVATLKKNKYYVSKDDLLTFINNNSIVDQVANYKYSQPSFSLFKKYLNQIVDDKLRYLFDDLKELYDREINTAIYFEKKRVARNILCSPSLLTQEAKTLQDIAEKIAQYRIIISELEHEYYRLSSPPNYDSNFQETLVVNEEYPVGYYYHDSLIDTDVEELKASIDKNKLFLRHIVEKIKAGKSLTSDEYNELTRNGYEEDNIKATCDTLYRISDLLAEYIFYQKLIFFEFEKITPIFNNINSIANSSMANSLDHSKNKVKALYKEKSTKDIKRLKLLIYGISNEYYVILKNNTYSILSRNNRMSIDICRELGIRISELIKNNNAKEKILKLASNLEENEDVILRLLSDEETNKTIYCLALLQFYSENCKKSADKSFY